MPFYMITNMQRARRIIFDGIPNGVRGEHKRITIEGFATTEKPVQLSEHIVEVIEKDDPEGTDLKFERVGDDPSEKKPTPPLESRTLTAGGASADEPQQASAAAPAPAPAAAPAKAVPATAPRR